MKISIGKTENDVGPTLDKVGTTKDRKVKQGCVMEQKLIKLLRSHIDFGLG